MISYAVFCLKKIFLMIRRPPRSTHCISSAASDVYKRQLLYSRLTIESGYEFLCMHKLKSRLVCFLLVITDCLSFVESIDSACFYFKRKKLQHTCIFDKWIIFNCLLFLSEILRRETKDIFRITSKPYEYNQLHCKNHEFSLDEAIFSSLFSLYKLGFCNKFLPLSWI